MRHRQKWMRWQSCYRYLYIFYWYRWWRRRPEVSQFSRSAPDSNFCCPLGLIHAVTEKRPDIQNNQSPSFVFPRVIDIYAFSVDIDDGGDAPKFLSSVEVHQTVIFAALLDQFTQSLRSVQTSKPFSHQGLYSHTELCGLLKKQHPTLFCT